MRSFTSSELPEDLKKEPVAICIVTSEFRIPCGSVLVIEPQVPLEKGSKLWEALIRFLYV